MTVCGAAARGTGDPCCRPAGWGTEHVGTGRCKLHGGKSPGAPVVHGRYSLAHRASLAEQHARFLADPRPGDLLSELAMMRALFQDHLGRYTDGVPLAADDLQALFGMLADISKLVERAARIENQHALTQAQVGYFAGRVADILVKYVVDPDTRRLALDELRAVLEPAPADRGAGPAVLAG